MDEGSNEKEEAYTVANLLRRIGDRRGRLEAVLAPLSDEEMSAPRADGWAVRDHLAHIVGWEGSLLALLRGESRALAVGLTPGEYETLDTDAINARILADSRGLPLAEVKRRFAERHEEVLAFLRGMSDAGLMLPYSHYQPNDPPRNENPVIGWIAGNTFGHYEEHLEWIEKSLRGE